MTKLQAEAIARQYKKAIEIHYQQEFERLQRLQTEANDSVDKWISTQAYRKRDYDRPYVPTYVMKEENSLNILHVFNSGNTP